MAKKKVSKKNAKDAFPDEPTPVVAEPSPVIDEEEEDEAPSSAFALLGEDDDGGLMNMISRASKKKSKKSKPAAFESDDDKDLGALPVLGSDEEEDVFGQIVSKKGRKKNKVLSFGSLEGMDDEVEEDMNMAPSKKGKKKKTKKELPSFDALDEDVLDEPIEEVELPKEKKKSKKSKKELPVFDALSGDEPEEIDEPIAPKKEKKKKQKNDDDLDALAALIEDASVQPSGKGRKNKKKKQVDEDLDALAALIEDNTVAAKPAGKGKKNKASQQVEPTDDSPLTQTDEIPEAVPEIKIKTAKQKEKERKERQKEEKRRLAAEQKAAEGSTQDTTSPTQDSVTLDDDTSSAKGKAKGKKGKGPSAAILALRKQQEALRAAEEEAARLIEEEKRKVEEEERRIVEQEKLAEEARLAKKQKDAEKREQLRKEGKLLTKSQKEAKRKAELRLIALKESGMIIPALSQTSENTEDSKPKARVFVAKRKSKFSKANSGSAETTPVVPEEKLPEPVEEVTKDDKKDDVKESWDASDDGIKDNWDDSDASEEEKEDDMQPKELAEKVKEEEKEDNEESEDSEEDSDSDDDSDESSEEELTAAQRMALQKKQEAAERRQKRIDAAMAARSKDDLRSPICCILGHVDTGKTKLLDKIRQTNVQEGEAGGITQQIGATYFPVENIIQKTAVLGDLGEEYKLPGVLVIDTPGHESFTNLRTRGSSLCNIAILVVDLMHGLEPQTLESIRLLRDRKTPFIVALNKIDRIYDWRATPDNGFQNSLAKQPKHVREEFDNRVTATITAFAEQGLNAKLYYENKNFAKYVSFVPTSAITGEGIPDLLHLLVTLTQSRLTDRLMYVSELECTVLEVKVIEGLGTTIDVVLSNGYLNEGDRIVVCGLNGPVVTQVRALLTPQPLRELRVKSAYVHHKRVKAALGIKISAPGLESVIAGSRLLVVGPDDDEEELKDAVMEDLQTLLKSIDRSGRGVSVQASTLGSLEALLEFLRVSKIPVSAINIGPVHKKDIIRASAMLEKAKEFAVMLAFDVEVDKDATLLAEQLGVRVFTADIIYHLFDKFTAYNKDIVEQRRKEQAPSAVFPCVLRMIPGAIFSRRDPIIFGADVVEGTLRLGTPICVVQFDPATKKRDIVNLGVVTGIENNHKPVELVKKGMAGAGVAVKIECPPSDTPKLFGRHFTEKDEFYSRITRKSIDVLKTSFREDLSKDEWALVVKLKKILDVI